VSVGQRPEGRLGSLNETREDWHNHPWLSLGSRGARCSQSRSQFEFQAPDAAPPELVTMARLKATNISRLRRLTVTPCYMMSVPIPCAFIWSLFRSTVLCFNSFRLQPVWCDVVCCDREMIVVDEFKDGFPTPWWSIRTDIVFPVHNESQDSRFPL
jgi:hypothetical protein